MTSQAALLNSLRRPSRRFRLAIIIALVLLCLLWVVASLYHRFTHVSADDARIMTHQVAVSSRLPGQLVGFDLRAGARLEKGEVIGTLYSLPEKRKLATLQAALTVAKARLDHDLAEQALSKQQYQGSLSMTKRELKSAEAGRRAASAKLAQAKSDYERLEPLFKKGTVSKQSRDHAWFAYQTAKAENQRARQEVLVSQSQASNARVGFLNGVQVPPPDLMAAQVKIAHQQFNEAEARLAQQQLKLSDMVIRSPSDGIVNKTLVNQGEYVAAGQPLLMMNNPANLWIEANIKETDIAVVEVGQPVNISVDAFPDATFSGKVVVVGRAATSQFALLPNPNPSGNFTKITQRIPVRIAITKGPLEQIGPGMMVEVDIDTNSGHEGD